MLGWWPPTGHWWSEEGNRTLYFYTDPTIQNLANCCLLNTNGDKRFDYDVDMKIHRQRLRLDANFLKDTHIFQSSRNFNSLQPYQTVSFFTGDLIAMWRISHHKYVEYLAEQRWLLVARHTLTFSGTQSL